MRGVKGIEEPAEKQKKDAAPLKKKDDAKEGLQEEQKKQEQEGGGEKAQKEERKERWIIIALILGAAAIISMFAFGITVRFALRDELSLELRPMDSIVRAKNNEAVTLNFTMKADTFRECTAQCSFQFRDIGNSSNDSIIWRHQQALPRNQEAVFSAEIPPRGRGEGQQFYILEAVCHNRKSLLCRTGEISRQASSLVALDYELTGEDIAKREEIKEPLEELLSSLQSSALAIKENSILLTRIPITADEQAGMLSEQKRLKEIFDSQAKNAQQLQELWKRYELELIGQNLTGSAAEVSGIEQNISFFQREIQEMIGLGNENVIMIKDLAKSFGAVTPIMEVFQQEKNPANDLKIFSFNAIVNETRKIYRTLAEGSHYSEKGIHGNLAGLRQKMAGIVESFRFSQSRGLFLILFGEAQLRQDRIRQDQLGQDQLGQKPGANTSGTLESSAPLGSSVLLNISAPFSCRALGESLSRIHERNNISLTLRKTAFNETLEDTAIDSLLGARRAEADQQALTEVIHTANSSSLDDKEEILAMAGELLKENFSRAVLENDYNLTPDELMSLAQLNTTAQEDFMDANCRKPGFEGSARPDSGNLSLFDFSGSIFSLRQQEKPEIVLSENFTLPEQKPLCCAFDRCGSCCGEECFSLPDAYPVLFVHGHTFNDDNTPEFSLRAFSKIQKSLEEEGYINGGELDLENAPEMLTAGEWGRSPHPITARASYYYINDYNIGGLTLVTQKHERIENYALRLREIIELLQAKTSRKKVNLVAHSMGGLVVREYLNLFGGASVDNVIFAATPHLGIPPGIAKVCSLVGSSKECDDMKEGSVFLTRLNAKKFPDGVNALSVYGTGCTMESSQDGDGIVTASSAKLGSGEIVEVKGNCTDRFNSNFHSQILDPDIYPETLQAIIRFLKGGSNETAASG
ncbi:alpha/beta fold hydrolase [Candidatus Woesearchaeota archaeon]|nr:alpha/beta fold hydrolase [Candidatus Woesearchaeota archaeon]